MNPEVVDESIFFNKIYNTMTQSVTRNQTIIFMFNLKSYLYCNIIIINFNNNYIVEIDFMPTLYVVSSKYMSLIANEDLMKPSDRAKKNARFFHSEKVTKDQLENTFQGSKPLMLGFKTKEEATIFTVAALKGNNSAAEFIDGQIPFFAVPVVYTVEYDKPVEKSLGALKGGQILSYMQSDTIPFYSSKFETGIWKDSAKSLIDKKIVDAISASETADKVTVYQIPKKGLRIVEAYYFACNPVREATVVFAHAQQDLDKIHKAENAPANEPACIIL